MLGKDPGWGRHVWAVGSLPPGAGWSPTLRVQALMAVLMGVWPPQVVEKTGVHTW